MPLSESNRWLSRYKSAWEKLDPRGVKALFAQNARNFETLYQSPSKA